jgi:hypothetical protein
MTGEMPATPRLVRQTFERVVEEYPGASDAQLLKLMARAARADDELKEAALEWTSRDLLRKLRNPTQQRSGSGRR